MNSNVKTLLLSSINKTLDSMVLVIDSILNYKDYDESMDYTPKEREPYDALSDRFIRCVEMCIKCFKSYDLYLSGEISNTFRDLLNNMDKMELISSVDLWFDMRAVRNRIVHDYFPGQITRIYQSIVGDFYKEIADLRLKLELLYDEVNDRGELR